MGFHYAILVMQATFYGGFIACKICFTRSEKGEAEPKLPSVWSKITAIHSSKISPHKGPNLSRGNIAWPLLSIGNRKFPHLLNYPASLRILLSVHFLGKKICSSSISINLTTVFGNSFLAASSSPFRIIEDSICYLHPLFSHYCRLPQRRHRLFAILRNSRVPRILGSIKQLRFTTFNRPA